MPFSNKRKIELAHVVLVVEAFDEFLGCIAQDSRQLFDVAVD